MHRLYPLLFLFLTNISFASSYYVSAEIGDNSHDGLSVTTPFLTIQTAADLTRPGDTVFIMNGVYTNDNMYNVFSIVNWGEQGNWIVYTALRGHQPKLKFNSFDGIGVFGACFVEISGLEIEGANDEVTLDYALANRNNLDIPKTRTRGIAIGPANGIDPHHIRIANNKIYKCGGSGIHTYLTDYIFIRNNEVFQCGWYSSLLESGIHLIQNRDEDQFRGVKNIISNNYVHSNFTYVPGLNSNEFYKGDGILIEDARHVYSNTDIPAYQGKTLIENNIIFNNGGGGISILQSDNVVISHNTAYKNNANPSYTTYEIGAFYAENIAIYNNILFTQAEGLAYGCYECDNFAGNYNLLYNTEYFPFLGGNDITRQNPLFAQASADPQIADFSLLDGSPALNVADLTKSSTHDFFGNKRTNEPDIGAIERMEINTPSCDAGSVFGEEAQTQFVLCAGDKEKNKLSFMNTSKSEKNYAYILTDDTNRVLAINSLGFQFEDLGLGVFFVYGVAYEGELRITTGDPIDNLFSSGNCLAISENHVNVYKEAINSGKISTIDDKEETTITVNDSIADLILLKQSNPQGLPFVYFLMDEKGIVLAINDSGFELEQTGVGTSFIGGAVYTGNLLLQKGIYAYDQPISDDCYAYSSNLVTISKKSPTELPPTPPPLPILEGGQVSTTDGLQEVNLCLGTDISSQLTFTNNIEPVAKYAYVVTDEINNVVAISVENVIDFSGLNCLQCFVEGVSYTGNIIAVVGAEFIVDNFSDGAAVSSTQKVQVNQITLNGGEITAPDSSASLVITTMGDEITPIVEVSTPEVEEGNYVYLLTDTAGLLLGIETENQFNVNQLPDGIYYIHGLNYTGILLVESGTNINTETLSSGCFALSTTKLAITKTTIEVTVDGGNISLPTEDEAITLCVGGGQNQFVSLSRQSNGVADQYKFIVTDEDNHLLEIIAGDSISFETAPDGICLIKGVSYAGDILVKTGDDLSKNSFSSGPFAYSQNEIEVTRIGVDGGDLSIESGEATFTFCEDDAIGSVLEVSYTTSSDKPYALTLIDGEGILLEVLADTNIDFTDYPEGFYFIRGVSYTGDVYIKPGDDQSLIPFSTGCFNHSNSIQVYWIGSDNDCLMSTAVSNLDRNQFELQLSPNPAQSTITIEFDNPMGKGGSGAITLYNLSGQLVDQYSVSALSAKSQVLIPVKVLTPGMYLAKINIGNYWGYQKFIKN